MNSHSSVSQSQVLKKQKLRNTYQPDRKIKGCIVMNQNCSITTKLCTITPIGSVYNLEDQNNIQNRKAVKKQIPNYRSSNGYAKTDVFRDSSSLYISKKQTFCKNIHNFYRQIHLQDVFTLKIEDILIFATVIIEP